MLDFYVKYCIVITIHSSYLIAIAFPVTDTRAPTGDILRYQYTLYPSYVTITIKIGIERTSY